MSLQESKCPYTIQQLYSTARSRTYVIREKDAFGEYPNIYAKVQLKDEDQEVDVIVLSDSGTGLDVANEQDTVPSAWLGIASNAQHRSSPTRWNIATFLEVLNPGHAAPYIVITTHCHYDHICGIQHLLAAETDLTVLSSSNDKGFITPWRNLQKHSLCDLKGLRAPEYDAQFVDDAQRISRTTKGHVERKDIPITIIHTPGHTPDSIAWYDHDTYTLCVGDTFYEKESDETRSGSNGQWSREPPQPVIFTNDSNIIQWNASMHRLLDFVRYENRKLGTSSTSENAKSTGYRQDGQGVVLDYVERASHGEDWSVITTVPARRRVALCAGHVTIAADAEFALLDMLAFMLRIQLDQVPKQRASDSEGNHDAWLWDDSLSHDSKRAEIAKDATGYQYSVKAPWSVIHRASSRKTIEEAPLPPSSTNTDFRSMVQRMTSSTQRSRDSSSFKSNALASVSHSSVMAGRPTVSATSITRKGSGNLGTT